MVAVTIHHSPPSADAGAEPAVLFAHRPVVVLDVGDPTATVTVPVASAPAATAVSVTAGVVPAGVVVTVQPGDSAWSIADAHLGDGMRWRDLWDANREVLQPDGLSWIDPQIIRIGWRLHLPTTIGSDPAAPSATTAAVQTVVRGDTLSGIADAHLGDPARYGEIFELNRDVEQPDGRRLTDPNLILPGWNLRLPDVTTQTSVVPSPPPAAPDIADGDPLPSTEASTPDTTPTTTIPTGSAPPPTTVPTSTPTSKAPPSDPRGVEGDSESSEPGWTTNAPSLAGIAGAVVLATGLAVRVRFLRRRQATRGTRADRPLTDDSRQTIDAVVAAADVPLVRWAGQRLAQLVLRLDRAAMTGAPVAVELSETSGIELLWDTPQPVAPHPWTAADGGWAWRLAYDPDAPVPADELPAAIPALVTIGHRDGRQLLIDLEAYGAITVTGDDDHVDAFLRSITIELATNRDLADAYVHIVGIDAGISYLDRLNTTSTDDAIHLLDNACRSVTDALDHRAAQRNLPRPHRLADTDRNNHRDRPSRHARRRRATHPGSSTTTRCRRHRCYRSHRCGRARTHRAPDRRHRPTGAARHRLLAGRTPGRDRDPTRRSPRAARAHRPPRNRTPARPRSNGKPPTQTPGTPATNGRHPPVGNTDNPATHLNGDRPGAATEAAEEGRRAETIDDGTDAKPAMLVRVLGTPTVPDRPDLSRRELILTVLLACRRGPVAASTAQDALWGGKAVEAKTVWNVIGATRQALGDLPDGTPVMPSADRARSTLRVAAGVATDVAVLRSLVVRARQAPSSQAIELLREGLALVEGQPFDAAGYDWAHRDQDVAEASALIEHAAVQLVDLALDSGRIDVARDAILRGLRGLPGNEELYRCRMRVEHHSGNLAGVSAAYEELVTYLADLETEPSPSTTALYRELVRPLRR